MDRRTFRFEDEEYLQQKREWWVCYGGDGGGDGGGKGNQNVGYGVGQVDAGLAAAAGGPGKGSGLGRGGKGDSYGRGYGVVDGVAVGPGAKNASRETKSALAGFMGLSDATRQRNFNANAAMEAAEQAGNRPEGPAPKAKVEPKPKPEPTPTPVATAPAASSSSASKYTAPTAAAAPAFNMDAYMAEVDARYADQMASIQKSLDAADEARQKQIDELTQVTEDKRKKIKSSRKQGRLSLLSGSELGIPMLDAVKTTLG
jgi:hypothetical protein